MNAKTVTVRAHAKINLTLDIVGRRPDGYHDLVMVMQSVGLYDTVTVMLTDSGRVAVHTSDARVADDESNIAYKAAKVFFAFAGIEGQGAEIAIEKKIPMEAGMAGGSADGAAVLVALNALCGTGYPDETLWDIGVKVGADIPFCVTGGTMLAEGKGEILTRLPSLNAFPQPPVILLCKPPVGVSTGKAYAAADGADPDSLRRPDTAAMRRALAEGNLPAVAGNLVNVFEEVLPPEVWEVIESIKRTMTEGGALGACMTGSGTTVFGLFDDGEKAKACAETLRKTYAATYVTRAADKGIVILEK